MEGANEEDPFLEQRKRAMEGIDLGSGTEITKPIENISPKEAAIGWFMKTGIEVAKERLDNISEEDGMDRLINFYPQFEDKFKALEKATGVPPQLMLELRELNQKLLKAKSS